MRMEASKKIEISVIVVTYNQQETIARTLDSILEQNCNVPFEIVIGDDCSSDSTESICRRYAEKYPEIIRYYRREPNLGVVENYFRCIENSRGRFLADCAGDDFWVDNLKLQKEYDIISAYQDISLVHTGWLCYNTETHTAYMPEDLAIFPRDKRINYPKNTLVPSILCHDKETMIHLCSAMYRRDIIMQELKENPEILRSKDYTSEDLQIIVTMAAKGKIVFLPDITLYYSISPNSLSHNTDFAKKFRQLTGALRLTQKLLKYYKVDTKESEVYLSRQFDYLSAQVFHSGDKELRKQYNQIKKELGAIHRLGKTRLRELLISSPLLWKLGRYFLGKSQSQ